MKTVCLVSVAIALLSMFVGNGASAVTWEGLTWSTRGASTTAVVDGNGWLDVTVTGGQSGDPSPDNWAVTALLPSDMIQANAPWVKFTIVDTATSSSSTVGGPRAYIDTDQNPQETMLQGGMYQGYSNYWMNHNAYSYPLDDWTANDWWGTSSNTRVGGDHTVMFGMTTTGAVNMLWDGVVRMSIGPDPNFDKFERAYLGVSVASGSFTGTYKSFEYGIGYVPEPSSIIALLGGMGPLLAFRRRRA